MRREDLVVGMKVVPHQKTAYGNEALSDSSVYRKAKEANQPFLYFTGWSLHNKEMACLHNENMPITTGDHFLVEDFEPYVEAFLSDRKKTTTLDDAIELLQELSDTTLNLLSCVTIFGDGSGYVSKNGRGSDELFTFDNTEELCNELKLEIDKRKTNLYRCYLSGSIFANFDYVHVKARNKEEAKEKAIELFEEVFENVNYALQHSDSTIGYSIDFERDEILLEQINQ